MAFQQPKKLPQFSDLVSVLARSQGIDDALYQTVQEIINRLDQFIIASGDLSGGTGTRGPAGPPGPMPALDQSFITVNPEGSLANHRQLIAGTNITLNTTTPGQIAINSSGGAGSGGMEYLGDYVTPHTYNDGDIVIASDGIAYVCTKNGTTTPPEPWPGIGLAVNATVDAKYWVVDSHAQLTNERVMSSLANGYVKSTAGEPSTVALIPISDTIGTLPDNRLTSNVALKNINNNFVSQVIGSGTTIQGTNSALYLRDTSGGVDLKLWRDIQYGDGILHLESLNDANSLVHSRFSFFRNGILQASFFQGDGSLLTNVIPVGTIVIRTDACPPGWSRVNWDGMFLRVAAAFSTVGGSNPTTHTHGIGSLAAPAHTHTSGSYTAASHNHGSVSVTVSGTTGAGGSHDHSFNTTLSGSTGGESAGIMNVDAGSSGNMARGPHTHSLSGVSVSGTTGTEPSHTHSFSGSGSGATGNATADVTGDSGSASATALTGASAAASHLPPYFDVVLCIKN